MQHGHGLAGTFSGGAGLATKISKLGTLTRIGSEVAIDATGSAIGQIAETGTVSLANTTIDVIAGQSNVNIVCAMFTEVLRMLGRVLGKLYRVI